MISINPQIKETKELQTLRDKTYVFCDTLSHFPQTLDRLEPSGAMWHHLGHRASGAIWGHLGPPGVRAEGAERHLFYDTLRGFPKNPICLHGVQIPRNIVFATLREVFVSEQKHQFSSVVQYYTTCDAFERKCTPEKQARGHVGSEPAFLRYIITLGRHRRANTGPENHGSMYFAMLL